MLIANFYNKCFGYADPMLQTTQKQVEELGSTVSVSAKEAIDSKNNAERSASKSLSNRTAIKPETLENETPETMPTWKETSVRIFKYAISIGLPLLLAYCYMRIQNAVVVPEKKLHPYEEEARDMFGQQILDLDRMDPRPKLLFLQSPNDHNNAFTVKMTIEQSLKMNSKNERDHESTKKILKEYGYLETEIGIAANIQTFNHAHDVKYKVIKSSEICNEIKSASQTGKLISVILSAHGNTHSMDYPDTLRVINSKLYSGLTPISKECFDGLAEDAEIILNSCSTGGDAHGIASVIAKLSQRPVWAPSSNSNGLGTTFTKSSPPVPTFIPIESMVLDSSCKFFPDGTQKCGYWQTKSWSDMKEHASNVAAVTTNFFSNFVNNHFKTS